MSTEWVFPDTLLIAGGYLLVWCDEDPEGGPLHASFKLSGSGEAVGLFGRLASGNEQIDDYQFAAQTADISEGRQTDGEEPWVFFEEPTPGASNRSSVSVPETDPASWSLDLGPSPVVGSVVRLQLQGGGRVLREIDVFDVQGRRVSSLWGRQSGTPAALTLEWNLLDDSGAGMAAGVYLVRVRWLDAVTIRRLLLSR